MCDVCDVCVCVCVCVCVAKPVAVELRCHATALIIYYNKLIYNSVTETSIRISFLSLSLLALGVQDPGSIFIFKCTNLKVVYHITLIVLVIGKTQFR